MGVVVMFFIFSLSIFFALFNLTKSLLDLQNLYVHGKKVSGEIVSFEEKEGKNAKSYFPVVKFQVSSGHLVSYTSRYGFNQAEYEVQNTNVELLYSTEKPERFVVLGKDSRRGFLVIILFFVTAYPTILFLCAYLRPDLSQVFFDFFKNR